ncbi:hypothetical protein [Aquirhabdus parva]|uniref:Uncharacterized protein n=1 Tax=Aquirhabdus parva TaxID=2283318 RepID=A0A345PAL8_9GAMM|nr:hypothetical protein [Aquirhabdus parva]AXI04327.1 hypothetical protein HYN46_16680 [Aquirhabdus parva]
MPTRKAAAPKAATETTVKEVITETVEKEVAKAESLVESLTEKAEKLADDVTTSATDLVNKVTDLVQTESSTIVEKVKSLIAQLQTTIHTEKSFSEISAEATALIKEVQTGGYEALKHDYALLRTAVIENFETLQANSSLKTFVNELIAKLPSIKPAA